jgi:type 1 glutamine amidotransferase
MVGMAVLEFVAFTGLEPPGFHKKTKIADGPKFPILSASYPTALMKVVSFILLASLFLPSFAMAESILLIAGPKSHDPGEHEHPAGCELLAKHLESGNPEIKAEVSVGWPDDASMVAAADTIVIYSDGEDAHVAKGRVPALRERLAAGKGLVVLHYALEPADPEMAAFLNEAIGGHFQVDWSVNPIWKLEKPLIAKHPVTRGVRPFSLEDEFYYHIRLQENAMPLLQASPPATSLGADGPRSGNPIVRKELADGIPQTLAWSVEHENHARGFGFTGGHFHRNWADPDFRKLVLNAIVWTAGMEVPENGFVGEVPATPAYQTIDEAIAKGDIADVRLHLTANPESANKGGRPTSRPPLEQAVLRKKPEIAAVLLEAGADPNSTNASKRTPLHLAVERNSPDIVTALLKAGAKPNELDKDGWTPLHHAAAKNQLETSKALLDGGADPKTLSERGGTPLHEAAASGGKEIIALLLKHKVDPKVKAQDGVTALDIAKEYKNQAAIEALSGL